MYAVWDYRTFAISDGTVGKYTGKATTSVTYEMAQQLPEAVLYYLNEQENYGNSGVFQMV